MTDREILAELKKSYEYLYDISENGCIDHCCGQMDGKNASKLRNAIDNIEEVFSSFYRTLNKEDLRITKLENKLNEKVYIAEYIGEDYEVGSDYTSMTCLDLDYFWYEEKEEYRK